MEWKIRTRRGITGEDVRRACVPDAFDGARWHDHPKHGLRLVVSCRTLDGVRLLVFLHPVDIDDGIWRLRTVFRRM